jgi:phosphatidate cytidylyltransferase
VNLQTRDRLFNAAIAFHSPLVPSLTLAIAAIFAITPLILFLLAKTTQLTPKLHPELRDRYLSWLILAPLIIGPVLLGAAWTILAVGVLSLLRYREFARATGLFRERSISLVVVTGIILIKFASLDNFYGFFAAMARLQ